MTSEKAPMPVCDDDGHFILAETFFESGSDGPGLDCPYCRITELEAENERLVSNSLRMLTPQCEKHTGENTPPFDEWLEKVEGRCAICDGERIEELQAENERLKSLCATVQDEYNKLLKRDTKNLTRLIAAQATLDECEPYLKEDETPAQCIQRNRDDVGGILKLLGREKKKIEKFKATLNAVKALPEKWRDISYKTTDAYTNLHGCADELEAILNQGEE